MDYDEARAVLTTVVAEQVSDTDLAGRARLSVLIDQGAANLVAHPDRAVEARDNFEFVLRTSTEGPYDSIEPQLLTVEGLDRTLFKLCPPWIFPLCVPPPQ